MHFLNYRWHGQPRSFDLIKTIVLLCILTLSRNTLKTIPYLQDVLDNVGRSDIPILSRTHRWNNREGDMSNQCLVHAPLSVEAVKVQTTKRVLEQPSPRRCGRLKRDWRSKSALKSPLAREMEVYQSNCSWPVATFYVDNDYGLGSHLYLWSQAACNAHEMGYRVRTYNPHWLWLDQAYCDADTAVQSPFLCYFPTMEYRCGIETRTSTMNVTNPRDVKRRCRRMQKKGFLTEFRAAAMEYIFHQVAPVVVLEAERQIGLMFGGGDVPADLITVHIRWGDKFWEMDLAPIDEYITAVCYMLQLQGRDNTTANIYLSSEDPRAVRAFIYAVPTGWNVYTDRTVAELDEFRPVKGNRASWTTRNTKGRAGLVALGSLLVALEANYFVLTTRSNWSRIMNELRKNVLDPSCGNCTRSIDLRPGEW